MNAKALHILEFDRIIEMLTAHADSEPAGHMCEKLRPSGKNGWIRDALDETDAAVNRIMKNGSISFGSNRDFGSALKSLAIGHSLSIPELIALASFLENVSRVKSYGSTDSRPVSGNDVSRGSGTASASGRNESGSDPEDVPRRDVLSSFFDDLTPIPALTRRISEVIISEEEISDNASPELASIRRKVRRTGERIHSQLSSMINGSVRTYLQDPVITMRGDRYCIPVKAEYKSQVPGMVHDQSSTGSTFFIEPAAVVELNNELKNLAIEEQREIERIIAEISAMAGEHIEDIEVNCKRMTRLDFIFAKARLALEMNAMRPIINDDRIIRIHKGRHPLIDPGKVVPIDVTLGDEFSMLIITGPNTGGKTVSLKTVGLLTLMGQAGLFIPAGDRSELSVFNEVFADIGDEQSIEQSLSTFSSHMTNIVDILKNATERSLCLFDELGAGTDPIEGAALATAILDNMHRRTIRTMATTHYSELKVYALSTEGVENASCEFDVEKLSPTYRLLVGIPGRSNAFAISQRLGLPGDIIEEAHLHMSEDQERFEDLMADLDRRRMNMERKEIALSEDEDRIRADRQKVDAEKGKLDDARNRILAEAREEARQILQDAKDEADRTIKYFREAGGVSMRDLEAARSRVRDSINKNDDALAKTGKKQPKPVNDRKKLRPEDIRLGDSVQIVSMGLKGTVTSLPDKSGKLKVQCGIMNSQTTLDDIILIDETDITAPGYTSSSGKRKTGGSGSGGGSFSKAKYISPEINLLGMTVDEAVYTLDKYLDDAYLSHLPSVRIVHGKGTGALRNAVTDHLRRTGYIASFRLGEYGEGDAGVTIAEFK